MKLMIASDIHGSAYWCRKLCEKFNSENPDRLLLLGDILYHGPRNDLPREYDPKSVIKMLNFIADKIICVRGNCDTEVDQMVLDFSIMSDSTVIYDGETEIFAMHGHNIDLPKLQKIKKGTVVMCGHTHIREDTIKDGLRYVNPGSVSIPKADTRNGYVIYENGGFRFCDL